MFWQIGCIQFLMSIQKKKKKKDAFKEVIILHDSSATDFTLGNLLFVTTLVFICQYL